ncbi:MAG: hypothetical protein KAF41_10385 [Flavobacterium sp.]|jgi:hypothetical protein|uniref:hypothetical protein n=1 Tax=Flavobacterium lindanitolerans TaxID=428988 RepID=UPI000DB0186B|nr:hypothetical protein [Flavobacterium lindanitolerans]MBU7571041.1 hypothetical protein [Flavobacterium sp.]PZO34528.1 MAG: hypothetical protein DCE86_01925 [Flavobacteriaceae bacterium]PZQ92677.1 MAG: hypothetical protein DI548_00295 [Flavobacterium johnsoniae]
MKTKQLFLTALLTTSFFTAKAQNVQSDSLATSGGLNAGITTSTLGGNTFYGYYAGSGSSGNRNTYIGGRTGNFSNGNENVYLGWRAGNGGTGSKNVLIGNNSGNEERHFMGSGNVFIGNNSGFSESESNNKLIIGNDETVQLIWGDFAQNQLKLNGKVGIGYNFGNFPTTAGSVNVAAYNLFVKGGILTEEVRVNLQSAWADYVFDENYKLKSLEEVETFIKENGHLENVPPAKQVKEEGIELGEITKIQQEKIEELTLYLIELNKENKMLQKKLLELEEKINNSNIKN